MTMLPADDPPPDGPPIGNTTVPLPLPISVQDGAPLNPAPASPASAGSGEIRPATDPDAT